MSKPWEGRTVWLSDKDCPAWVEVQEVSAEKCRLIVRAPGMSAREVAGTRDEFKTLAGLMLNLAGRAR